MPKKTSQPGPYLTPHDRRVLRLLADRFANWRPEEEQGGQHVQEGGGPPPPNSQPEESCQGDVTA